MKDHPVNTPVASPFTPTSPSATSLDRAIVGMTYGSCIGGDDKASQPVSAVTEVRLSLPTEIALGSMTPKVSEVPLTTTLENSDYAVTEPPLELSIKGMTCATCVIRVENALLRVPGVTVAEVSLATAKATVTLHGATVEQLITAVKTAGYKASVPESSWLAWSAYVLQLWIRGRSNQIA